MSTKIDDERMRLLRRRLDLSQGEVVLPAAFVEGLLRELDEAREVQRRWEQYRASVDALLGRRSMDEGEVGP